MTKHTFIRSALVLALALSLGACSSAAERLKNVGKAPALSAIEDPTAQPGYKAVRMPMPEAKVAHYNPNSLWQTGDRAFFKDQRAARVGDILTVQVQITDRASFQNTTKRERANNERMGIDNLFGYESTIARKILPGAADVGNLVGTGSNSSSEGKGSIDRTERLTTNVAAVVTQILPNGNMVIEGKQEVRVNFEVRELIVAGIVRPEDIASDNIIDSSKIAQARIAYGGRGQITDVQQPRYGQQVLDVLLPF